jgi:hypothetical protein
VEDDMSAALIGKYFMGTAQHGDGMVEAAVDDAHYLVRFDAHPGGPPEALAVVALSDMVRAGNTGQDEETPHWLFFDNVEQRAKYWAWLKEPPPDDPAGKPRVVSMRRH